MNAEETLKSVSKTWCNIKDLMNLTGLSKSSAIKLKSKIKEQLDYEIHTTNLPMNVVVDFLKIDINYLKMLVNRKEEAHEIDQ